MKGLWPIDCWIFTKRYHRLKQLLTSTPDFNTRQNTTTRPEGVQDTLTRAREVDRSGSEADDRVVFKLPINMTNLSRFMFGPVSEIWIP